MHPLATSHQPLATAPPRRGFTLTELLVVIAIIAMLAALVSVAVMRAMNTAKQSRIKIEVDQLDASLKAYKDRYGSYPPCDLDFENSSVTPAERTAKLNRIRQHVARAFPRFNLTQLIDDLKAAGVDTQHFRPDQALVFWLRGFGPDPQHPFVDTRDFPITAGTAGTVKVTRTQFYDFDIARLASNDTLTPAQRSMLGQGAVLPSYFPAEKMSTSPPPPTATTPFAVWGSGSAPYVYFAPLYGDPPTMAPLEAVPVAFNNTIPTPFAGAGTAVPYWNDLNGNGLSADFPGGVLSENWANPDSFQIISAGGDGKYGASLTTPPFPCRMYPTGTFYDASTDLADDDNVTNFCGKARLEDAKP